MKAVALIVLLSFGAYAADPAGAPLDAPLATLDRSSLCLTPEDELLLAKHIARIEAENAELKRGPFLPGWAWALIGVGVAGVAFAAGYGVAKATAPQP